MGIPTELDGAKVIHITSNSIINQFGTIGVINDKKEIVDELQNSHCYLPIRRGSRVK